MKKHLQFVAGVAVGALLFGGGTALAAELIAKPSEQTFYLRDEQVELEAYSINNNNYVKLRDVGQLVGFDVSWRAEDDAAIINPDIPYYDDTVAPTPTAAPSDADYSAEANPDVFTADLTREVYNAVRDTIVRKDAVLAGTHPYTAIPATQSSYATMDTVTAAMGSQPAYQAINGVDGLYCEVSCPDAYTEAAAHTKSFLNSISEMSQREQVEQIAWYVCDRLTYRNKITSPAKILAGDDVYEGNCTSYAHSFIFLCGRAGIPCLLQHSDTHQWNKVYVDGEWWEVDITAVDAGDDVSTRSLAKVLLSESELQGSHYKNSEPAVTAFIQELLVPGSTK